MPVFKLLLKEFLTTLCRGVTSGQIFSRRIISGGCHLESYDSVCCVWCSFVLSRFMLYTTLQLSVGCINDVLFTNLKSSINFNLNRYVNP